MKYLLIVLFALTIPAANWLIQNVGTVCVPDGPCLIPVFPGIMAPSGVLMIGIALVLRDMVQEYAGWKWSIVAVLIGSALSFTNSPAALATASAVAFLASEIMDMAVYTKLRSKGRAVAVMSSQIVGAFIDSAIFVFIAFGSMEFSVGNTLGKIYAGAAVALLLYTRNARRFA